MLQPLARRALVTAALLQERPRREQEEHPLLEQEEHQLLEQVLELATGGKDLQPEALHLVIPMLKTALLVVVTTLNVLPQRAVHVRLELAVIVRLGLARLARLAAAQEQATLRTLLVRMVIITITMALLETLWHLLVTQMRQVDVMLVHQANSALLTSM
jgi:hypothetical protein